MNIHSYEISGVVSGLTSYLYKLGRVSLAPTLGAVSCFNPTFGGNLVSLSIENVNFLIACLVQRVILIMHVFWTM